MKTRADSTRRSTTKRTKKRMMTRDTEKVGQIRFYGFAKIRDCLRSCLKAPSSMKSGSNSVSNEDILKDLHL